MWKLIPQEAKFFDLFDEEIKNVHYGAKFFKEYLENYVDYVDLKRKAEELHEIEHKGDQLTYEIIGMLNKTFITPFDREDIYQIARALDDILDHIEGTLDKMYLYKIGEPTEEAKRLAGIVVEATGKLITLINGLRNIKQVDSTTFFVEIKRLENEGDKVYRMALAKLFDGECSPLDVIKWKETYEHLETATDLCLQVAKLIEGVIVKYA